MEPQNLLTGPPPTLLPEDPAAHAMLDAGTPPREVAAAHPTYSLAWALLAEEALGSGDPVAGYAFARTGYHRGLDQLRRAGWKGHGPVPWDHGPNRGFLLAVALLGRAAAQIGEVDEEQRCRQLLRDSTPSGAAALEG